MSLLDEIQETLNSALNSEAARKAAAGAAQSAKAAVNMAQELARNPRVQQTAHMVQEKGQQALHKADEAWHSDQAKKVRSDLGAAAESVQDKIIELASQPETRKYKVAARAAVHKGKKKAEEILESETARNLKSKSMQAMESARKRLTGDDGIIEGEFTEHATFDGEGEENMDSDLHRQ